MAPPPPPPPKKPANQEHKSNFSFGSSKPTRPSGPSPEMVHNMSDVNRRVRMVEESLANLRKKVELENENTLSDKRSINADIHAIYDELSETKKVTRSVQDTITKMIKEVQSLAKKEDVQVLQKYINIWKPIQFVTQKEVSSIVQAEVARILASQSTIRQTKKTTQEVPDIITEDNDNTTQTPTQNTTKEENNTPNTTNSNTHSQTHEENETTTANSQTSPPTQENHIPSGEQKRRIAQFIEAHDDIKELLLHDVDSFIAKVANDDMLQMLFKGVDLHAFSQKLQDAYGVTPKKETRAASRNEQIFGNHSSTKLDDMFNK